MQINKTINILSDLVAFPCLGGESNLPIANYIEQIFKAHNLTYHLVPNDRGNKTSIHCRIGPAVDGGVILSGHTDVVPTKGQPWTRPDFQLTQEGEKLFARGSTDMKGFIACCLSLLPEMIKADLKKPIYLAFSYDEEVVCLGGPDLVKAINTSYREKPAYAIIGEPTNMKTVTGEKGIGAFTTKIVSSAAHSALVRSNVSAITEATYLIKWLSAKMELLIKKGHIDKRFDPPHTTIHVGTIKGGTAVNIIADYCEFEWDVRNIPTDNIEAIVEDFRKYCQYRIREKQKINPHFNIETLSSFPIVPSLNTPNDTQFVQLVNQLNGTINPTTVAFASEAGQYAEGGFESILCGPGDILRAHRADEYIEVSELQDCLDFLKRLIVKINYW